jgi:NifU-like protein
MSFYPPEVRERSTSPSHAGTIDASSSEGVGASFLCGAFAKVSLRIDEGSAFIGKASFTTNGCGFMIAAGDALASWLEGKKLNDLHGLPDVELHDVVGSDFGEFPTERKQCMTVVFEALRASLAEYRLRRVKEFRGETALICTCFGVTEDTIVETIEKNDITGVEDVTAICRAGSGCGSCRMLIAELIDNRDRL